MSDFRSIYPVSFLYEHDNELIINQNKFATQQGLDLNLVNALSACQDETILNYSNIFLSKPLPINDVVYLPYNVNNLIFSTFLAVSAYPDISTETRYVAISSNSALSGDVNFVLNLSSVNETYYGFTDINGIQCRISSINQNETKSLTIDPTTFICSFTVQTPATSGSGLDLFEYALDDSGFLRLFFRLQDDFYIIREVDNVLSGVNVTNTVPLSTDIFYTTYKNIAPVKFKNDFIYYGKQQLNKFGIDNDRTKEDVPQNHVLFYNYQSDDNFLSGSVAVVDLFKTKNVLSNTYNINDILPANDNSVVQREYTNILSKQSSELYSGDLQFNYNYYTKEYVFPPDVTTKFTLPEILYPYSVINVDDSNLARSGAFGGQTPVYSDKIIKRLDLNANTVNYNEANGTYLYTWLYTDAAQLTSFWLDRYYNPKKTSLNVAYSGSSNQVFTYTSELDQFLSANYPANDYLYYDIRSSLTLEPSASYLYSRIGSNYVNKVVATYAKEVTGIDVFDSDHVPQDISNNITFNGDSYGVFNIDSDNNSFAISFDLNAKNIDAIKSNLIVGNNFDEGISLYKGGIENIFTPGYLVNTLTGVEFLDINNTASYSINASAYVGAPTTVLDIINTGFDHLIKLFYIRTDTSVPGILEFNVYGEVFNKYEFDSLANVFNSGLRINLFGKTYSNNNSEIWYFVKDANPSIDAVTYKFDYIDNTFLGVVSTFPASEKLNVISIVNTDDTPQGIRYLSGFDGQLLENEIGISKLTDTVYFTNVSGSPDNQFPALSTGAGGIFDVAVLNDRYYVQTNGGVLQYDKYKRLYKTYPANSESVSGVKIDFINDNFKTKLITYTANNRGKLLIDRYDIQTGDVESSFTTDITVNPIFFKEFQFPKRGTYTSLVGIGIVTNEYIGPNNPPPININAIIGARSDDSTSITSVSGTLDLFGAVIPEDFSLNIYRGGTRVSTVNGDGKSTSISVTFNEIVPEIPYLLECVREKNITAAVRLKFGIINGTFYNGSFRNVVVGSDYQDPPVAGFANAFFTIKDNSLTDQYGFVTNVNAIELDTDYVPLPGPVYASNVDFNGVTSSNPLTDFYHEQNNPHLRLVVNPALSSFTPTVIQFTSNSDPLVLTSELVSGGPFQVPTNFQVINNVNKFSEGDLVARIDLYTGSNTKNRETHIVPFDVDSLANIVMSFDVQDGDLSIYNNAQLVTSIPLSADTFYTSYFLKNNFGVGVPYINNKSASLIGLQYDDYPTNYSINNFHVYGKSLNSDEVKFNFLQDKKIDTINFDVPAGIRNATDTTTAFNKFIIPGRKNNNIIIYIKNAFLDEVGREQLKLQLIDKVRNVIPLNIGNIEFKFLDYD